MQIIRNMKISTRLIYGFGAVLFLMLLITALGIQEVNKVNNALTVINDVNSVKQRYAINFRGSVHDRSIAIRDIYLVDSTELQATIAEIQKLDDDYQASAVKLDQLLANDDQKNSKEHSILDEIKDIEKRTQPLIDEVIKLQSAGKSDEAYSILMNQARPAFVDWLATINQFIDLEEEKNKKESVIAQDTASNFATLMIVTTVIALILGGSFALWIIISIRPLATMTDAMKRLAANDLDVDIPTYQTTNEIGQIADAVHVFKNNALEVKRLEQEQAQTAIRNRQEQAETRKKLADEFDQKVGQTISQLVGASGELQSIASNMQMVSSQVQSASESVSASTRLTSENISTVASATEEMTASSNEISNQVSNVAEKSSVASGSAQSSSEKVNELNQLATDIDTVVTSIKDIADQTNLLALNATIESARAGEAGKGFAVVASEVKGLAGETAKATEEIMGQIEEIQSATKVAVQSMEDIIHNITDISQASAETASAADQQNSVISEITLNISQVSQAAQDTTTKMADIESASTQVDEASKILATSSDDIASLSSNLQESLNALLAELRREE